MSTKNPVGRGGKREGSGRKPLQSYEKTIRVWISLPTELADTDSKEVEAALRQHRSSYFAPKKRKPINK